MAISTKYGRTYHFPFSPGTTSDDRIYSDYWQSFSSIPSLIHTEKMDGENNCLSKAGVFARSHAAPTKSPWTAQLRQRWQLIKHDLGDLELFGENLYAVHSIEYRNMPAHFFVFGIRHHDVWLSWEETAFYAACFDFPCVPVLETVQMPVSKEIFEATLLQWTKRPSTFNSFDAATQQPCSMEGIVTRNTGEYSVETFAKNVCKYVREGHVKTDEHWTKNWKRAHLTWEGGEQHVEINR